MENIDIIKTKLRNKLVFKTHWIEYSEIFAIVLVFSGLGFILFLIYNSSKDLKSMTGISLVILTLLGLTIYKIKRTRQLVVLKTGLSKETNRLLIADFIGKKGYKLRFYDNDYLRAISRHNFLLGQKELTVLFDDYSVLLNIVLSTGKIRFPSPIELRKFIMELNKNLSI